MTDEYPKIVQCPEIAKTFEAMRKHIEATTSEEWRRLMRAAARALIDGRPIADNDANPNP